MFDADVWCLQRQSKSDRDGQGSNAEPSRPHISRQQDHFRESGAAEQRQHPDSSNAHWSDQHSQRSQDYDRRSHDRSSDHAPRRTDSRHNSNTKDGIGNDKIPDRDGRDSGRHHAGAKDGRDSNGESDRAGRDSAGVSTGDGRGSGRDSKVEEARRSRHHGMPARRPAINPNSKQAELLASVASEANSFSNDGSFMARFAAQQPGAPGESDEEGKRDRNAAAATDDAEVALSGKMPLPCCSEAAPGSRHATVRLSWTVMLHAGREGDLIENTPVEVSVGLGGNQGVAAALRARLKGDMPPPAAAGSFYILCHESCTQPTLVVCLRVCKRVTAAFLLLGIMVMHSQMLYAHIAASLQ